MDSVHKDTGLSLENDMQTLPSLSHPPHPPSSKLAKLSLLDAKYAQFSETYAKTILSFNKNVHLKLLVLMILRQKKFDEKFSPASISLKLRSAYVSEDSKTKKKITEKKN